MRVCFLTHYFPPEVGAPQTRIELLARTLAARGVAVTVHTCFPHYPSGIIPAPYSNRLMARERRLEAALVTFALILPIGFFGGIFCLLLFLAALIANIISFLFLLFCGWYAGRQRLG